jgi:hypothetical protein
MENKTFESSFIESRNFLNIFAFPIQAMLGIMIIGICWICFLKRL